MNDFTKEELEKLRDGLSVWLELSRAYEKLISLNELMDKIQSMIDNYCEHEDATSIHPGDTVAICNTCQTILSHWNYRKANPRGIHANK